MAKVPKWRVRFDQMCAELGWDGRIDASTPLDRAQAASKLMSEAQESARKGLDATAELKIIGALNTLGHQAIKPPVLEPVTSPTPAPEKPREKRPPPVTSPRGWVTQAEALHAWDNARAPRAGEDPIVPKLCAWADLLGLQVDSIQNGAVLSFRVWPKGQLPPNDVVEAVPME